MQDLYMLEVKEKKAAVRNYKTGRTNGRRSSKSMFPSEYMTKSQLKEYTKGGEIKMSNIYDQILSLEEYNQLEDPKKKTALEHWRKIHTVSAIKKSFSWNDYSMYKEFDRLGIEVKKRKRKSTAPKKDKQQQPEETKPAPKPAEAEAAQNEIQAAAKEIAATALQILPARQSGSTFFLDDVFTPEEAISKLMKYAAFLEGEPHKVKIRLEITEIKD